MCDQQSLRSACAYVQSDQSLCMSLEYSMIFKLLTEHHFEFISLKGGCRGSSESTHVKMPHCWKSHATAQFIVYDRLQKCIKSLILSKTKFLRQLVWVHPFCCNARKRLRCLVGKLYPTQAGNPWHAWIQRGDPSEINAKL